MWAAYWGESGIEPWKLDHEIELIGILEILIRL